MDRTIQNRFNTSDIKAYLVRMPRSYHEDLKARAESEGTSVNYLMLEAIEMLLKRGKRNG